jgi:hypothetical protein
LATSVPVLFIVPPAAYPIMFWVALATVVWVGIREAPPPARAAPRADV